MPRNTPTRRFSYFWLQTRCGNQKDYKEILFIFWATCWNLLQESSNFIFLKYGEFGKFVSQKKYLSTIRLTYQKIPPQINCRVHRKIMTHLPEQSCSSSGMQQCTGVGTALRSLHTALSHTLCGCSSSSSSSSVSRLLLRTRILFLVPPEEGRPSQCLLAGTRGSLDSGGLPQLVVWNTLKVCCGNLATKGKKENHLLMLLWLNEFAQIYGEFVLLESFGVEHSPKLLLSISIHQPEHYWQLKPDWGGVKGEVSSIIHLQFCLTSHQSATFPSVGGGFIDQTFLVSVLVEFRLHAHDDGSRKWQLSGTAEFAIFYVHFLKQKCLLWIHRPPLSLMLIFLK